MNVQTTAPRIDTLESVRGLAALLIVLFHIPGWNLALYDLRMIRNGNLMVELFFVLSGFVIYNAYAHRIDSWRALGRFQFLRFGRLYPVHLLFLLVFLCIEIAKYLVAKRLGMVIPNSAPFRENNGIAFLQQLALLQDIGPTGNALTFNIAAWSISVEFYTYLLFGLVVLFAQRLMRWSFAGLFALSIGLLIATKTFGFEDLLLCTAGFFLGCLTALSAGRFRLFQYPWMGTVFLIGILALLQFETRSVEALLIFPLTAGLVMSLATCQSGWMHAFFSFRGLTWLGGISYSLYMSHETVLWAVNQVFRVILKRPERIVGGRSVPQLSTLEALLAYGVALTGVLLVAYITCRMVEEPFRQKSRDWLARKRSVVI